MAERQDDVERSRGLADALVEHVTKDGTRYRLAAGRYRELADSLRRPPIPGMWIGALLPVALGIVVLAVQYVVAGAGLLPDAGALGEWGIGTGGAGTRPGGGLSHLFLQCDRTWLAANLVLLLGFGVPLGWRDGAWRVGLPLVAAGLAGGAATCLLTGGAQVGLWYGVVGVIAVAMWRFPSGRTRETVIPWTMIAGLLVIVLAPHLLPGGGLYLGETELAGSMAFPVAGCAPPSFAGPAMAAVAAALLMGIFLLPTREMDCGRVGAVATLIAIAFAVRFSERALDVFYEPTRLLSAGNWLGIVFDLLILVIACLYSMSQAEMLRDMRSWPVRDRLDALIANEGERTD